MKVEDIDFEDLIKRVKHAIQIIQPTDHIQFNDVIVSQVDVSLHSIENIKKIKEILFNLNGYIWQVAYDIYLDND